jgi:hypothetical protein
MAGVAMAVVISAGAALGDPATSLDELGELNIAPGERVDFSTIVGTVSVDGEPAEVAPNFPDTSVLVPGRHTLVYTAMTFGGKTATKQTFLNVGGTDPLAGVPVMTGVAARTFSQGRIFDLLKGVEARSAGGEPLVCRTSIPYPEHLAPGEHTVHFTAVDGDGKSAVASATVTVLPVDETTRKAEWARLGNFLYEKYFEPARLAPYLGDGAKTIKTFSYSTTEPGIVADVAFRGAEFDMLTFDPVPMKIEPLCARMLLLLKELRHHRYLWLDQEKVVFAVELRGKQQGSGDMKERGIYSVHIPADVFKKETFDEDVIAAFQALSAMPTDLKGRTDGKGKISRKLYDDAATGIKILFMEDLIEGFASNYNTRWRNGEVTLEENFDSTMLGSEYEAVTARFARGEFGRFTNPKLPFVKQQHPDH